MSGKKREIMEILCDDVEIPEVVTAKAEAAFQKIRMSGYVESGEAAADSRVISLPAAKNIRKTDGKNAGEADGRQTGISREASGKRHSGKRSLRRAWTVGIAAACAALTVSVGAWAAYRQWSRSLEQGMQADETMIDKLESDGNLSSVGQSVTDKGVTVTMSDCLVDRNCALLIFKVEGYTPEDNLQPGFSKTDVTAADGSKLLNGGGMSMIFYDGLSMNWNGEAVNDDGTPCTYNDDGSIVKHYVAKDGSLEYQIWMHSSASGELIGKSVHVEMQGLGVYSGREENVDIDVAGTWNFDFELPGSDNAVTCEYNEPLGDTQAVLKKAEITPLSVDLYLTFPRQEITEMTYDENGDEIEFTTYAEPSMFSGFKMKDGTYKSAFGGGGFTGYQDDSGDTYRIMQVYAQVVDTSQIESLLFLKPEAAEAQAEAYDANGEILESTDDDFFIIPLQQ